MTTPYLFRHPDSGIYYFRIAIPKALRTRLKQREWKKSLKTRDPREAQRTARRVTVQVDYLFSEFNKRAFRPTGYYMPRNQDDMARFDLTILAKVKNTKADQKTTRLYNEKGLYLRHRTCCSRPFRRPAWRPTPDQGTAFCSDNRPGSGRKDSQAAGWLIQFQSR